jgi:hypothetical protein
LLSLCDPENGVLQLVEKYLKFDQSEQTELYGLWLLANLLTEKNEFVTGEII